jgi:spatacsin
VLEGSDEFVKAFKRYRELSREIAEEVVRKYQEGRIDQEKRRRITGFVMEVPNLLDRFRLAKKLGLTTIIQAIEKDSPIVCEWEDEPNAN